MNSPGEALSQPERLIIAITGASGAILGIRLLAILRQMRVETHLILSPAAEITISQETAYQIEAVLALADYHYRYDAIAATPASGSFKTRGMIIAPCSIKTLSAVANSWAEGLIARAADVTLKEGRPLLLAVRETPLHRGHLRLMDLAAQAGAILFPPVPAFYARPQNLEQLVDQLAGRMLDRLGFDNPYAPRWQGLAT